MGFKDSVKKMMGLEEIEDDIPTDEEINEAKEQLSKDKAAQEQSATVRNRSISFDTNLPQPKKKNVSRPSSKPFESTVNTGEFRMVLIEPKSFDECNKLVDSLKHKNPVIINLETLDLDTARKIYDFMSGATYALSGCVQKVSNNIFIFAPENVDIREGDSEHISFGTGSEDNLIWRS